MHEIWKFPVLINATNQNLTCHVLCRRSAHFLHDEMCFFCSGSCGVWATNVIRSASTFYFIHSSLLCLSVVLWPCLGALSSFLVSAADQPYRKHTHLCCVILLMDDKILFSTLTRTLSTPGRNHSLCLNRGGGTGPADPAAAGPIIAAEGCTCAHNVFAQLRPH